MKENYIRFYIYITLGLILIIILYPIILSFFLSNSTDKGTFGDSFGAVNTFFSALALSGVIISIIMQRNEMSLQREEMSSSRYEYIHNRVTNLVYWQLEKYENSLNILFVKNSTDRFYGNNAIYYLDKNLKYVRSHEPSKEERLKEAITQKIEIIHNLTILSKSKDEITTFIISAYNCISALNNIIENNNLNDKDKKELRNIFNYNVGIVTPSVLETIDTTVNFLSQFFKELEVDRSQLQDISKLMDIFIYIDEIREFLDK